MGIGSLAIAALQRTLVSRTITLRLLRAGIIALWATGICLPPALARLTTGAETKASSTRVIAQPTTSRAARAEGIRSLPLDRLQPEVRAKVSEVVSKATVYRRAPVLVTDCHPQMYQFLIRNPEVMVNIWDVMGISNVKIKRTSNTTFRAADGHGTRCTIEFLHGDREKQLIYAQGYYEGPLFTKPVRAQCVLLLRSGFVRETSGRYYVTGQLDTFIKVDHVALALLTKTFQPLVGKAADVNFTESVTFLGRVSRTAEANPQGLKRLAARLENVQAEVRTQFIEVSDLVAQHAEQRVAAQRAAYERQPPADRPAGNAPRR